MGAVCEGPVEFQLHHSEFGLREFVMQTTDRLSGFGVVIYDKWWFIIHMQIISDNIHIFKELLIEDVYKSKHRPKIAPWLSF